MDIDKRKEEEEDPWSEYEKNWKNYGDELWFDEDVDNIYDPHYEDGTYDFASDFILDRYPEFSQFTEKRKDIISVLDDTSIYNESMFYSHVYENNLKSLEELADKTGLNLFFSLMSDVFNSLYKSSAIFRPSEDFEEIEHPLFKKQLLLNKMLLKIVRKAKTFKELKEDSTLNIMASKELTHGISSSIIKIYKSLPFEIDESDTGGNNEQEQQDLFKNPGFDQEVLQWGNEEKETIIGIQIEKALKGLKAKIENLMSQLSFWGITKEVLRTMSPEAQKNVTQLLNNSFHSDVMNISKAFLHNGSNKEQTSQVTTLIKNVMKRDDDIGSIIARDKALLGISPMLFFKKLINRELLCLSGFKTTARGPIICCIDDSGSMSPPEGEPAKWARAVFMSLANMAIKTKRHISGCTFSTDVVYDIDVPPRLAAEKKIQKVFSLIDRANGGGTNFERPLIWAYEQIYKGLEKADIIFITDGECNVEDNLKEMLLRKKKDTKTRAFLILVRYNTHGYGVENVLSLFDEVFTVDLSNEALIKNVEDINKMKQLMKFVGE